MAATTMGIEIITNSHYLPNIEMKTQTQIELNEKQQTPALTVLERVRHFARSNLVATITVTLASSLLLTSASSWYMWNIYQGFRATVTKKFEVQKSNQEIIYLDEALTMSAQMAATTGNLKWQTRYDGFVPKLDLALKDILDNVPDKLRTEASKTDPAVAKLIDLEAQAFKLVQQGKSKEALQIMEGEEYTTQKKIYANGNRHFSDLVGQYIQQELQSYQQQLLISMLLAGVTLPVLLASWLLVLSAVRDYIRDRQTAGNRSENSPKSGDSSDRRTQYFGTRYWRIIRRSL
jgi:methyl-accepting chemotaxis protein PixJ